MNLLRLAVGFLLFIVGLGYLFHPQLILQLNAFARGYLFRDSIVLLQHRRIGILLLLASFILIALTLISAR